MYACLSLFNALIIGEMLKHILWPSGVMKVNKLYSAFMCDRLFVLLFITTQYIDTWVY